VIDPLCSVQSEVVFVMEAFAFAAIWCAGGALALSIVYHPEHVWKLCIILMILNTIFLDSTLNMWGMVGAVWLTHVHL